MSRSLLNALAVTGLISLLLSCSGVPNSELEPYYESSSTVAQPVEDEQTTPQDKQVQEPAIGIPPCTELVSMQTVQDILGPLFINIQDDLKIQGFLTAYMGPSAIEAFDSANVVQECTWAMEGSDGLSPVRIAVLPEESREVFVSALKASDFVETPITNGTSFALRTDARVGPSILWYGFHDNIVVASLALSFEGSLGQPILQSVIDANAE